MLHLAQIRGKLCPRAWLIARTNAIFFTFGDILQKVKPYLLHSNGQRVKINKLVSKYIQPFFTNSDFGTRIWNKPLVTSISTWNDLPKFSQSLSFSDTPAYTLYTTLRGGMNKSDFNSRLWPIVGPTLWIKIRNFHSVYTKEHQITFKYGKNGIFTEFSSAFPLFQVPSHHLPKRLSVYHNPSLYAHLPSFYPHPCSFFACSMYSDAVLFCILLV